MMPVFIVSSDACCYCVSLYTGRCLMMPVFYCLLMPVVTVFHCAQIGIFCCLFLLCCVQVGVF